MRVASLLVALVLTAGVLWLAGEQHRKNCISDGRRACSVLPWMAGTAKARKQPARSAGLTLEECLELRIKNAAAENTADLAPGSADCRALLR
jgi:hypothetical protein